MILIFLCIAFIHANKIHCNKCKHFIKPYIKDQYVVNDVYGTCDKFTYVDIVTGEIQNKLAMNARLNENECGKKGKFFEPIVKIQDNYQPTI